MSTESYIILRGKKLSTPTIDNLGMPVGAAAGNDPESLKIEEAELSNAERFDLRRDPEIRAVAPPMPMKLIEPVNVSTSDIAASDSTWGIRAVGAIGSPYDGTGITVAVLDTGIDPNHSAFSSVNVIQKNFTTEGDNDLNGHGTHCAGTIFGGDIDGMRIGIARNIKKALIGKVLGAGGGSSATIAQAIHWAVDEGANVVSMSLGIDFPGYVDFLVNTHGYNVNPATSIALEGYRANINLFSELANYVKMNDRFAQACLLVGASGNESRRPEYEIAVAPPAAGSGIVSVGALQESPQGLQVAYFSNNQVDISAPGFDIISAVPGGGLTFMSGTSMATPHVAGVAALWAQRQLEIVGRIESVPLLMRTLASGIMAPMASGVEEEDVGTGIIQAPMN